MTAVLLSVHVLAAIVLIGPVTAAASLFPRYAREAAAEPASLRTAELLHRVSGGYAVLALAVPAFGIGTAARMDALGQVWLTVSMALTAGAALLLAAGIVPGQRRVLAGLRAGTPPTALQRLSMVTGLFALTWAVVVVLMIVRPGSTTGV